MTDPYKLNFPSGTFTKSSQGSLNYMELFKTALDLLGVTYPSSGGGGGGTLQETLTLGNITTNKIVFEASTTLENQLDIEIVPSNYGTIYPSRGVGMGFSSGWAMFDVNLSGRPNVVGTMWGYNHSMGGGRVDNGEAAFGFRTETHYEMAGGNDFFEFHLPEFTDYSGVTHRVFSWYLRKDGTLPASPSLEGNGIGFLKWGDQNTSWGSIGEWGVSFKTTETNFNGTYPTLLVGSIAGTNTINGITSSNWDIHFQNQGDNAYIGHVNGISNNNLYLRTYDNFMIGTYGGSMENQRVLFIGGRAEIDHLNNADSLYIAHKNASRDRIVYITNGSGQAYFVVNKEGVILRNGTTANRPSNDNGAFRYNSETNEFEGVKNGVWVTFNTTPA
jgi:hypothetical protein